MSYLVRCFENGKITSNTYHDDKNMAMDVCRMYVARKTNRSASVFTQTAFGGSIIPKSFKRLDDFFGTEKGYIYNAVTTN